MKTHWLFQGGAEMLMKHEEGWHASRLREEVAATASHTYKTMKKLREAGLIITEKQGSKEIIILTEKGQAIQDHLLGIKQKMNEAERRRR